MSSLLEQAIVDAKALRDAALRNAEQMVVEKYSDQIKEAVTAFFEQEEEDPMADLGLGDEPALDEPALDDSEGEAEDLDAEVDDDVSSLESGQVEIDLDAIEKKIAQIEKEEGMNASDALDDEKVPHDDLAADMGDEIRASADADSLATEELNQLEEDLYNDIMESLDLDELVESLKVDMKPQKRGWMGVSNEELDHAVEMELARAQDDEVKEQMEELKSALKKLEESNKSLANKNKTLNNKNKQLNTDLNDYKEAVLQLKEKFDVVNTSNAKLLYINRTLDCASLNERQKKSIVEAIAKAEDAKEAKVIYETLQNTVETPKVERSPESLSEAVNRNSNLLVRSREEKTTTSANIFAERMQRLAGITRQ